MNVLSLFDGMSCGRIALERSGVKVDNYYASEVEKWPIKVSMVNYPDIIQLGSVENWREWDIDWSSIDMIIAGSPCQGFSYAGEQLAFEDERSSLYFVFEEILHHCKPRYWMLENVRMKPEHLDTISNRLSVDPVKINSSLVSAQNRVRYYWFNWGYKEISDRQITLQSVESSAVGVWTWPRGWNKGGFRECDKCPTLTTSSWQYNFKWYDSEKNLHKFTAEQAEQFQTVPVGYTSIAPITKRFEMLGNGWTVDVVAEIFKQLPETSKE